MLALSAWVGVVGATAGLSSLDVCSRDRYALESLCWYVPEYSSLWRPFLHRPGLTPSAVVVAGWCAMVCAYLAVPLVRGLLSSLRTATPVGWARGWRI